MSTRPAPEITDLTEPYWSALSDGRMVFSRCGTCAHAWLPPRSECPRCLGEQWSWEQASGAAALISWVTFHIAYHSYFEDKLPYRVAVVELDEGPRLIAPLPDARTPLVIDAPLTLDVRYDGDQPLAMFRQAA